MTTYDNIYQAALILDAGALKRIKAENLTLNVWNDSGSVIEQLANEEKHASVDLLLGLDGSKESVRFLKPLLKT